MMFSRKRPAKPECVDLSSLCVDRSFTLENYMRGDATTLVNTLRHDDYLADLVRRDPVATFGLYQNHIEAYTDLFSKPCCTFKSEYIWKIWALKINPEERLFGSKIRKKMQRIYGKADLE